jgi:hypothetical protein
MWLQSGYQCPAKTPPSKIANLGEKGAASCWELHPTAATAHEPPGKPQSTRGEQHFAPDSVQMKPESS